MMCKLRWLLLLLFVSATAFGQVFNNEWIDYGKTYYKFKVFGFGTDAAGAPIDKGMVRIPYTSLAAAGLAGTDPAHFQLWRDGKEVPVYVSSTNTFTPTDYIEFWGEINNGKLDAQLYSNADFQLADKWSLQTDTAAYFLTTNPAGGNKRLAPVVNNVAGTSLTPQPFFMYTVGRYYRNDEIYGGFYASAGQNLYSSSYDRGEGWLSRVIRPAACGSQGTLAQNFPDLKPHLTGPASTVRINAVGNAQNSRVVKILLNGDSITLFQMDYLNYEKLEEQVATSKLAPGYANFNIVNQSSSNCDEMRLAMVELTYPRQFDFNNSSVFNFSLPASPLGRFLKIANFNKGGQLPVLYDIANGRRYVADTSIADTLQIVLQPSTQAYELVLTTQAGTYYNTIADLKQRSFTDFSSTSNQGNYLIISNKLIYGSGSNNYIEQYKQYRASAAGGSYTPQVIDIDELVDQFAWGVKKHPLSIKNFLKFARSTFATPPAFAFLIGKGVTYNAYRQHEANPLIDQLNLVPTWGNPASDNILASNDFRAVPATPIGRLSAISPQEVGDYLQKVKQYDSAQQNTASTIADKGWMKNVLQIAGANDLSLGQTLDNYMAGYKAIIADTSFGANVTNFSKTADPAGYTDAIVSFKNIYEKGSSLITYFGHSSATSLDFNLDDPESYNNDRKYPVFIANGCSAGNHFAFETNRLNNKSTISEKFVLAPAKGAIGYLASTHFGVVNYLNIYTRQFYKAIGQTKYGSSAGEIVQEAIARSLESTGNFDFYSRVHAETYAWHGDPAIRFNTFSKADYVIEGPQITHQPSFVSTADTSLSVKVKVHNIGKAVLDSVSFQLKQTSPNGTVRTVSTKTFAPIPFVDSITVEVPIVANRDSGVNVFTATINYNNSIQEVTTTNNSASKSITFSADEIRPIYPYNNAIINNSTAKVVASTVSPLQGSRSYMMEMDTTALFNSAFKISKTVTSKGGVVEFEPGITYQDGKVYYWRVSPAGLVEPVWRQFSFSYRNSAEAGFSQSHNYQHMQSQLTNLKKDSTTGKLSYTNQNHNLYITHSIYPTSGTEDSHFSISVDGSSIIRSACVGSSVIINVFDSLTFVPWRNTTQPFGAAPSCGSGREYNFEYSYKTPASRKNAMDFLDALPSGAFVVVRSIYDLGDNNFAAEWASDTALYGSNNSLYHRLKQHGFTAMDSFYFPRTWAFVFQKNVPAYQPEYSMSIGLNDKITLNKNARSPHVSGTITSPKFGPAKAWSRVRWSGFKEEANNDSVLVQVVGVTAANQEAVLYSLNTTQQDADVSTVDVQQYPFLKLRMINTDSTTATPYQLSNWEIIYTPVAEGAIAPNLYFSIADTIGTAIARTDTMHIGLGFKNVSTQSFDSLTVKVLLLDTLSNNSYSYQLFKVRPLAAGDTLHIDLPVNVMGLEGKYNVYVEVNPGQLQPEQFSFNNFLYKNVYIHSGKTLPVNLVSFNATLQHKDVRLEWLVTAEVNTSHYLVQHSVTPGNFQTIGILAATGSSLAKTYGFDHNNPPAGKNYYRLQIVDRDGTVKYSPVRLVNIGRSTIVNVYPNPVKDIATIVVSTTDGKPATLTLVNTQGQRVWSQKQAGTVQVDMSNWAAGTYLLQVDDGKTFTTYKLQKQ